MQTQESFNKGGEVQVAKIVLWRCQSVLLLLLVLSAFRFSNFLTISTTKKLIDESVSITSSDDGTGINITKAKSSLAYGMDDVLKLSSTVHAEARPNFDLHNIYDQLERNALKFDKRIEGNIGNIPDQTNIYRKLAFIRKAKTICETGFNAGHSAASWLYYSDPGAIYYGFDAGSIFHEYPEQNAPLLNRLMSRNGKDRVFVTFGDSSKTLPTFVRRNRSTMKCELVHIDGGHFGAVPKSDLWGMFKLSNRSTLLIMDDIHCTAKWCKQPVKEWEKAKKQGWIKENGCRQYRYNEVSKVFEFVPLQEKGKFPRGFCWGKYLYEGRYEKYENVEEIIQEKI